MTYARLPVGFSAWEPEDGWQAVHCCREVGLACRQRCRSLAVDVHHARESRRDLKKTRARADWHGCYLEENRRRRLRSGALVSPSLRGYDTT